MKEIAGNFGKVVFVDCIQGMKELKDKQFDLVFSDPPWGYEYNGQNPKGINQMTFHPERINYGDTFDDTFNMEFFKSMNRVSRAIVMIMGRINLFYWIRNTEPIDLFTLVFKNGQNSTKISKYNGTCQFLCYGEEDFWKNHKFHRNFYETFIHNGFLRLNTYKLIHPSPKDFETWSYLLRDLKPASVLDPFAGSCCIGEVAEFLGIPWLGFEINPEYYNDCEQRIKNGMKLRKSMLSKKLRGM